MAKGRIITDQVRNLITKVYLENPKQIAKEVRDEVEKRLRSNRPNLEPGWPGLSAVQNELTKIRKRQEERPLEMKILDTPWYVGSLSDYELPPEALPIVLKVWLEREKFISEQAEKNKNYTLSRLTIRQAKWVAKLSHVISDIRCLDLSAMQYALDEQIFELSGLKETLKIDPNKLYTQRNLAALDDSMLFQFLPDIEGLPEFEIIGPKHEDFNKMVANKKLGSPEFYIRFKIVHKRMSSESKATNGKK